MDVGVSVVALECRSFATPLSELENKEERSLYAVPETPGREGFCLPESWEKRRLSSTLAIASNPSVRCLVRLVVASIVTISVEKERRIGGSAEMERRVVKYYANKS